MQIEKLEKNMAKLTIEVSAEELEKAIENAYQKQKKQISIPGFRKGKVPRKMIEQMYGKGVFYEDAANELIGEAYEKAYDECEEEIVSYPTIDVVQLEAGKPFIFTAEVALKPAVTLGQYKGVEVEKADLTVTDEEVDAALEEEREKNAREVSVEDRAVLDGDKTIIDFEGFVDGVAFAGGKGENYPLTIGSGAFIPGFEEQLIGAELGVEVEVNVTFPEDYQAENLAGKPAVFKCTVREIKAQELPELDDEFAEEISEFATLEEYKANLKKSLEEKKAKDAKNAKQDAAVAAAVAAAQMEIPEAMVETKQRQMLSDFEQRMSMQGLTMEMYYQFTGSNPAKIMAEMKETAQTQIQNSLVLEAIVAAENIVATDEDYEAELATMGEVYQMEIDKMKEMLDEKQEENIRKDIAIRKAAEFVAEHAVEK